MDTFKEFNRPIYHPVVWKRLGVYPAEYYFITMSLQIFFIELFKLGKYDNQQIFHYDIYNP